MNTATVLATRWFSVRRVIILGVLALLASLGIRAYVDAGTSENLNRRADPAGFLAGELNTNAVESAQTFADFPLVWLGEEFEGYKLTSFLRRQGETFNKVYLIYGDCDPDPDDLEPSCVPPLAVVINAPGYVPQANQVEERVAGPTTSRRGVTARVLSGSMFLWTGGVVISVKANSEHMEQAIAALETVNHEARNEPAIGNGDDLTPLATR